MPITQAFVGDEEAIRNLPAVGSSRPGGVAVKGIDLPTLGRLHEVLSHRPVADLSADFPQVRAFTAEGPFIHRVPADLRDQLTFLGTYGIVDCAARWSGAESDVAAPLDADSLATILSELVDLANTAKTRGKEIYVSRS